MKKILRLLGTTLAAAWLTTAAFAGDPAGIWKWSVTTPNGEVETTLTLVAKDGKLTGTYSNSFGDTAVSNVSVKDDAIAFDVERDLGGNKFVLKYRGKLDGDTIKGTLEVPPFAVGEEVRKLDWSAKRAPKEKSADGKSKV